MFVDRFISFEQITESEPTESAKGHAEEKEIRKIKKHFLNNFKSTYSMRYVNYPPISSNFSFETVPNNMMATASFKMPYPNRTALRTGNFSALMSEFAATVSVAQSTLLRINTYVMVNTSKILLITIR